MLGAHNDITAIMQAEHELNEKHEIEALNKKLYKRAHEDYLTGLLNRGALEDRLYHLIEMAKRDKAVLSIVMIDIDFFKQVNDNYGHIEGDNVLTKLAKVFTHSSRTSDVVGRYGGEEFIILMPHTNKEEAIKGAERVRLNVQNHFNSRYENLTISAGVTTVKPIQEVDVKELATKLFKECDEALYVAKKSGRNKVIHFNDIDQADKNR
jgi:diguanylate cyclase (GGDEF)-like protein